MAEEGLCGITLRRSPTAPGSVCPEPLQFQTPQTPGGAEDARPDRSSDLLTSAFMWRFNCTLRAFLWLSVPFLSIFTQTAISGVWADDGAQTGHISTNTVVGCEISRQGLIFQTDRKWRVILSCLICSHFTGWTKSCEVSECCGSPHYHTTVLKSRSYLKHVTISVWVCEIKKPIAKQTINMIWKNYPGQLFMSIRHVLT